MKKMFLFFALMLITALHAIAQMDSGTVIVLKDPRIDMLVKKQAQINEETTRNSRRNMPGFRIQIINTIERGEAFDAKTRVYQLYPELKAYLLYQAPYYRIKVGNFKTRQDAEDYLSMLSREFAKNVFIVRDIIEVKPEAEIIE